MASPASSTFSCGVCGANFTREHSLQRHVKEQHTDAKKKYDCHVCNKTFVRKHNMLHHKQTMHGADRTDLKKRKVPHSSSSSSSSSPERKKNKQSLVLGSEQLLDDDVDPEIRDVYINSWSSIRPHFYEGRHESMYNFRWGGCEPRWDEVLWDIFNRQQRRFKINLSHSFILHHREDERYRFFHASKNNARVFEFPRLINNREDFENFLTELNNTDVLEHARLQRPDSKWTVHSVTSTSFYINCLQDFGGIGCSDQPLPDFIKYNKAIHCLENNPHTDFPYLDNLCFFRCLALGVGGKTIRNLDALTHTLFRQWVRSRDIAVDDDTFPGVTLSDLDHAEELFAVSVNVYGYDDERCLVPLRRSVRGYSTTISVLCFSNHFCYIENLDKASRSFSCPTCGKLWKKDSRLRRHQKTCAGSAAKEVYPGGVYKPPSTPCEVLKENSIEVDADYVFPYRATFDFEAYLVQDDLPSPKAPKTVYSSRHEPMSVSICSNVPGYQEPVCLISSGDPQDLVNRMIDYLEEISDQSYLLLKEDFSSVYEQIDALKNEEDPLVSPAFLESILDSYLRELPVVGFNSSRYDLNLIKPYFFRRMVVNEGKKGESTFKFLIKNNNEYKCVSTERLKFMDVSHFIAPGFSYSQYLAAFGVEEKKGFFPYEFFTDLDKLDLPQLPSREAFYSSLKNETISEDDYLYCQSVWEELGMRTMRDFLIWYNNKDVVPFLLALEKQSQLFQNMGLDMLKDGVGVPGLTLRYLFKTLPDDVYFSLAGNKQKDLHKLLRDHMVGGPSIVFHRYHEKGLTRLRHPTGELTSIVEGYDANALYLWGIMQDMPTEQPVIRRKETGFRAEVTDKYGKLAREWLEWMMHTRNVSIRHKHNHKEQALGKRRIRVDGWDAETKTVYQFHGCLFHGHDCPLTHAATTNPVNGRPLEDLKSDTDDIRDYLVNALKVRVIEIWECQWEKEKSSNPNIISFITERFDNPRSLGRKNYTTLSSIVGAVKRDRLFGLVQCDLEVPEDARARFEEMTPIFKNAPVCRNDVGAFMKSYAEERGLLNQPASVLVGSYFAKGILLTTPLLKWYLSHGFVVTDVQMVVEYRPRPCFREFGESVSDARREGDLNPSKAILAETFKTMGNSSYGKTITNLARHNVVKYVPDKDVSALINDSLFKKLTPLDDDLVEVELGKSQIRWSLPLQIGFFVYQYAKLRMLEFYYDCLDKFVSRKDFQLCQMDTDSLYMALSGDSLEDVVRPELKREFFQEWNRWFPARACDDHLESFVSAKMRGEPWETTFPCCLDRQRIDKRTPGLFKLEYKGDGIVALCSKTYFCFGDRNKISCKGLSKRLNSLTKESYLNVLRTKTPGGGVNKSFRTDGTTIYTYQQRRNSLSYFYIKRRVQADGVSTFPILV